MSLFIKVAPPLLLILSHTFCGLAAQPRGGFVGNEAQIHGKSEGAPTTIEFREFFEADAGELRPSAKLLGLNGRRVRLVGFMAQMEQPPDGAFYICPRPVYADESGGGTADLPVGSVRVIARSAKGKKIPFIARAIEVTGILEVGNRAEDDGTVSAFRLVLDTSQESSAPPAPATSPRAKNKTTFKQQRRK